MHLKFYQHFISPIHCLYKVKQYYLLVINVFKQHWKCNMHLTITYCVINTKMTSIFAKKPITFTISLFVNVVPSTQTL